MGSPSMTAPAHRLSRSKRHISPPLIMSFVGGNVPPPLVEISVNDRQFKRDMGSWIKFMKIAIDRQLGADDESIERIKRVNVELDQ